VTVGIVNFSEQVDAPIEAKLRRGVAGGFVVAALMTILLGFLSWRSAQLAADDADWVTHTYAVMDAIGLTSKHLTETEIAVRTFALTGQDSSLTQYETAEATIQQDEAELRRLTADNPKEQRRMDVLEPQVLSALSLTDSIVAKRRQLKVAPVASEIHQTERLMNAALAIGQEMHAEEMQLLSRRIQRARTGRRFTGFVIVVGIFVGAGLLALARLAINREIDVSAQGREEMRVLNASLEQRVEERTMALQSEIAERKRTEEAREQLAAIVDSSEDAIISKDLNGTINAWNGGAEKLFGYSAAEAVGKPMLMLIPPERRDEESNILGRIRRGQSVHHFETVRVRKDATEIEISATISPIKNSSGTIVGASQIARDISERKQGEHALKQSLVTSEAALQQLAEQKFALDQHAIVAITDVQGTISYVNDKFCAISQYSEEELVGQNHRILNSGHHPKEFFQQMYHAIANGGVWHGEIQNRAKDGSIYWVDTTIVPFVGGDGKPRQYVAIRADITERKRAENVVKESLATSEAALKELADQKFALDQHAIVAVTDVQGTITYVNDRFCAISQYSKDELLGQNYRILNSGHHSKEFFQQMYHTITSGAVWHGEFQNRAKDGSIYWVDTTIVPFIGEDGKPWQYVTIRADITGRKLAAASLAAQALELSRQAEELARSREALETQTLMLQSVLDSMTEGLAAVDEQGKFVIWNAAAEKILGMGATDLPDTEWTAHYGLFMADTVTPFPAEQLPVLRAIRGEVSTTEMYVRNHRLPQGAWIEVSAGPRKDGDGMVCGGVAAFRDVTKRKEDQREIQKLSDELEHRVIERTAQLETANKELEAFSYSVSHDLRAPLRHIGGFSKLLVEEFGSSLDPNAQHYVERIQSGTQKMGVLVDELLNLARVGRHALSLQPTKLNSIVAEVIAILQPDSQGRHVEWVIADLPTVECDPVLVKQVFQNLLSNSLKFTRPRARADGSASAGKPATTLRAVIEVSHKEEDGQPVFIVRDNGVGFNMKYVDKLFGVFQRLHSAEEFEGTGIGLVTVQRIVQKHGGRVWAEAELNKGASFYFTLGVGKQVELKCNGAMAGGQS